MVLNCTINSGFSDFTGMMLDTRTMAGAATNETSPVISDRLEITAPLPPPL